MSLVSLYRSNAAMCLQMAMEAKSAEARNDWSELAAKWSQKAEGRFFDDVSLEAPAPSDVFEADNSNDVAPSLVPIEPLSPHRSAAYLPNSVASKPFDGNMDELWARIANVSLD